MDPSKKFDNLISRDNGGTGILRRNRNATVIKEAKTITKTVMKKA